MKIPGFAHGRWVPVIALALIAVGVVASLRHRRDLARRPAYTYYERAAGDTLNVAVAYSPMSLYRHDNDSLSGLNYEVMRGLARRFGFGVKFFPVTDVSRALGAISAGRYDVLMADIPVFASQREHYLFTVPVYTDRQVLVSRDTVPLSPLGLAGKRVYVASGSPAARRLGNLAREIGDSIHVVQTGYTAEQLVMMTAHGEIPRAVVNEEVARRLMPRLPGLRMQGSVSLSQLQSWILNRDSTRLLTRLNERIDSFRHTREYGEIMEKWGIREEAERSKTFRERGTL